ncbi:MAG: helix-turn-helix transcriptional regulator [Acidobacteria bacterium]|jgi:transcriptional regulator with XRE-family HTH domain|nr:helix-turn-helix transcriptional regulator [Acidobacteriota bacterium]
MSFGKRLRQLRLERKINQRVLATQVGVDFTYLSKIENGRMPPPSEDVIVKLAKVLETNADELLRLAQKVPQDLQSVINRSSALPSLLRTVSDLNDSEIKRLEDYAKEIRAKREN